MGYIFYLLIRNQHCIYNQMNQQMNQHNNQDWKSDATSFDIRMRISISWGMCGGIQGG
jgi:hypothetical protein